MKIDRKTFLDSVGGPEAVDRMDSEGRADALEEHMMSQLNVSIAKKQGIDLREASRVPTAAEIEEQIETRPYRMGVGFLFVPRNGGNVKRLPPMPAKPTLADFFRLRFSETA